MGVVYKAFDSVMRRDVAIKTLHDVTSKAVLDLFYRECDILRGIVHPNVVDILDMGDYEDDGVIKPYYVMPLLPGKTLYDLLHPTRDTTEPLSVDRSVEIIAQTSRGLHAAHEHELLHRDVKPRNIFVIDEYSVKLIDFGVAHLLNSESSTGIKGTLEYMAPEQLRMKPLSRRTDIFSIATVCYEILTGRQPFRRDSEGETAAAVVNWLPPLACDVNTSVPKTLSQVISKAMAKDPWSRFASAAEFAEALQKARRNEPLNSLFDPSTTRARVDMARSSFEQKDYQFASEILRELEAEGQGDSEIQKLRRGVDEAMLRQTTGALLESADRYFQAQEYSLALRKVQEILELDPRHSGALALKSKLEDVQTDRKITELVEAAGQHLERAAYTEARKALQDALRIRPDDTRIRHMLSEVDSRQKEFLKARQAQEKLYQASQAAWVQRDISQALLTLERLAELARQTPEPRERIVEYKNFYKLVRGEHDALLNALDQARRKAAEEDFGAALALCAQYLGKYPRHAAFSALKAEVEAKGREKRERYRAEIEKRLGETPQLEEQANLLDAAIAKYPEESYYSEQLGLVRDLQAEVATIAEAAQLAENAGDFDESVRQWARLRGLYPNFAGLEQQISRVTTARDQARQAAKSRWREDIEAALRAADLDRAAATLETASAQFPGEFDALGERLRQERRRKDEARHLLDQARNLASAGRVADAVDAFRRAYETDRADAGFGKAVLDSIAENARRAAPADWKAAEQYLQTGRALDVAFALPGEVLSRIEEGKQAEFAAASLGRAAELEKAGDLDSAVREIDQALTRYPRDKSLTAKRAALEQVRQENERRRARERELEHVRDLGRRAATDIDPAGLDRMLEELGSFARRHRADQELYKLASAAGQQLIDLREARASLARGDLAAARALSDKHLQADAQHAGFIEVQRQLVDRERTIAAEYLDEVNRKLLSEPNLDRRIEILETARRRYPGEPYYQEQLQRARNEQELVRSIVEQAGALEKAGRFKEALDQWNRLRSTYPHYPGLDEHAARVAKLQEQALEKAKSARGEQIRQALNESDFSRAAELARLAEAAFPGQFGDLAKLAGEGQERRAQSRRLIAEAQEHASKGNWTECRVSLKLAFDAAPRDKEIAKQLLDAHVKYAKAALEDWRAADALLQQAEALYPPFRAPAGLRSQINERRRAELVENALAESKRLRESGNLKAALEAILAALKASPGDSRLQQRKTDIEAELHRAAMEEARRRAIEELHGLQDQTRTIADPAELNRLLERAQGIARSQAADTEVNHLTDAIREQVQALRRANDLLASGKFDEAEKLIGEMLSRYSAHSGFLALQQQVRDARESAAAAYLDELTHKLREVRDLGRREEMLLEAIRAFPEEPYYQYELDLVRDERRIVDDIAERARAAEKAAQYEEALELWNRLRTVYSDFPNMDAEISRVNGLLAQSQAAARQAASAAITKTLDKGDLRKASELLRAAESQFGVFPEGPALQARIEALSAANRLIAEGRAMFEAKKIAEGCDKFREAARKAAEGRMLTALAVELVERAAPLVDSDWRAAQLMLQTASALDPRHPAIAELSARIETARKEELVNEVVLNSRQLEEAGNLQAAENAIRSGLDSFPREPRLMERHGQIQSALHRIQTLAKLAAIEAEIGAAKARRLRQLLDQIGAIEGSAGSDREIGARAHAVREAVRARIDRIHTPVRQTQPPVESPRPKGEPAPAARSRRIVLIAAACAALLVVGLVIVYLFRPPEVSFLVRSNVAGAAVEMGGKKCVTPDCSLRLKPGAYPLTATKNGYKTISQKVTVSRGRPEFALAFEPLPQALQVNTNFESGRVSLDGRAAGELKDGQFSLLGLTPGRHTVTVNGSGNAFDAEWQSIAGEPPKLLRAQASRDVQVAVVTNSGAAGAVACNCGVQSVAIDGAPAGKTAGSLTSATPVGDLREGTRELTIAGQHHVVDIRPNPTLTLLLSLERNSGTLVVQTAGQDNAKVYLNGRIHRGVTEHGAIRIPVDVGTYSVRVAKDGFQSPPEQRVEIGKGEEKQVTFALVPSTATLEIAALGGAEVKVDGRHVGVVGPDGTFRGTVDPGVHRIELSKDGYSSAVFQSRFDAGGSVRLGAAQLAMNKIEKAPDPIQLEARDWERVRNTTNADDVQAFLRNHPNGAHANEARALADRLGKQAADTTARRAEQAAWDRLEKSDKAALQAFLNRYGNGPHAADARQRLDQFEAQEKDAAARAREQQSEQQRLAEQQRQAEQQRLAEQAKRAADIASIQQTLAAYESAYNNKNLGGMQAAWPSMPKLDIKRMREMFKDIKSFTFQLQPTQQPQISGDSATVTCVRRVESKQIPSTGDDRVRITLSRAGAGWIIRSIEHF